MPPRAFGVRHTVWKYIGKDGKHEIYRCGSCNRLGVVGGTTGSYALGECDCMTRERR